MHGCVVREHRIGEMIRTTRQSGERRFQISSLGPVASVCVLSALLWSLVLAPAARADPTPHLTDATTQSATNTFVGHTVNLVPGAYGGDPTGAGIQDGWYDCGSGDPQTPPQDAPRSPRPPRPHMSSRAGDVGHYIVVFETDLAADAVTGQTNPVASNTLAVSATAAAPAATAASRRRRTPRRHRSPARRRPGRPSPRRRRLDGERQQLLLQLVALRKSPGNCTAHGEHGRHLPARRGDVGGTSC